MQVGSFGFNLILTTKLNLSQTTSVQVVLLRPDGSYIEKNLTASAFTAPAQATPQIWTVAVPIDEGDLPVAGTYRVQMTDITDGRRLPSSVGSFNVVGNLR